MVDSKDLPNSAKFAIASISGMGASLVSYPLELLKTRIQVFEEGKKTPTVSIKKLITEIVRQEGIFGLYNGLSASLLRQATYTGVRLGAFQTLIDYFTDEGIPPNILIKCLCGVVSGIMGGMAGLPADVALTRMAADGNLPSDKKRNYTSVFNAIKRISREEGFTVLYRGLYPTVLRSVIVNISQLVSYSQAKQLMIKYEIASDNACYVLASIFSALVNSMCVLPPDIAKTRLQNMAVVKGRPEYRGIVDVWIKVVTKEGVLALWKGFMPVFFRNGPHFTIMFLVYENLTSMYRKFVLVDKNKENYLACLNLLSTFELHRYD